MLNLKHVNSINGNVATLWAALAAQTFCSDSLSFKAMGTSCEIEMCKDVCGWGFPLGNRVGKEGVLHLISHVSADRLVELPVYSELPTTKTSHMLLMKCVHLREGQPMFLNVLTDAEGKIKDITLAEQCFTSIQKGKPDSDDSTLRLHATKTTVSCGTPALSTILEPSYTVSHAFTSEMPVVNHELGQDPSFVNCHLLTLVHRGNNMIERAVIIGSMKGEHELEVDVFMGLGDYGLPTTKTLATLFHTFAQHVPIPTDDFSHMLCN